MITKLDDTEMRIVGCLVEKELTTPDNFPLTLNSLISACNQKTNRDPVMELAEDDVMSALERLRDKNLVYVFYGSGGRVPKYNHMFPTFYELEPSEVAVTTVLMLRGAQTAGEINQRTGRLYTFHGIGEVNDALEGLIRREDPLVERLPRQPGQKEDRFRQLFQEGAEEEFPAPRVGQTSLKVPQADSSDGISEDIELLREELRKLRSEFEAFKEQFE